MSDAEFANFIAIVVGIGFVLSFALVWWGTRP